jgi:hypothetical protein
MGQQETMVTGKNCIMWPEDRRHVCRRISDGGRRGPGDQRAGWRDPRAQAFPGANALWAVRAGRGDSAITSE